MSWIIEKKLAFPVEEYHARLDAVRSQMNERRLDALLVSTPENICYLSGFDTPGYYYPQSLILTHIGDPLIVARSLEGKNIDAHSWLDGNSLRAFRDNEEPMAVIAATVSEVGASAGRVGVDFRAWYLTIDNFRKLERAMPSATIVDAYGIVEMERAIKSPREMAYIRSACTISERGMHVAVNRCQGSLPTEAELAADIHREIIELGSEYPGLPLFLSSGRRTLVPHATWSTKRIERGENVFVELTGVVERYAGPLFRTIFIGRPNPTLKEHAKVVEDMLAAVIDAIRPSVTSGQVNEAAKRAANRLGSGIIKRAGYSVGLNYPPDWGEGYFLDLKAGDKTMLRPGMVFHIPQTVRIPGELPVAISETVMVTESGSEVLTNFPRELIVVD